MPVRHIFHWKLHGIFSAEMYETLELDISYFSSKGEVLLCGDFNAGIGKYNDSVSSEGNCFISENLHLLINEPHLRKSFDNNINNHGKLLLEICKSQNLKILNGRKPVIL